MSLHLYCEQEKIGTVSFELNDFLSDKVIKREMFKVFSGKKLPILSWGLKASIGLVDGGREDITRVRLTDHKSVYVTSPDYYTCDALPDEWVQTFEETQQYLSQLLNKSEMKSSRYSMGISRNSSGRKLNQIKNNLKNISVGKINTSAKELRIKSDLPDLAVSALGSDTRYSPTRSLFGDDKSVSHVPIEREMVDESMEAVRKILVESIEDYEKGAIKPKKKKVTSAKAQAPKIDKSPKATLRTGIRS